MPHNLSTLATRPGWTIEGRTAIYQRDGADWRGRVTELPQERASRRWHAAIIRGGRATETVQTIDPIAAAEWVERRQ
jgi:hypothetical protein